ncbi:hypothetical protein LPMP_030670 [Leishmania panamensis]|uniref:Uncharacterized protein n=1 Tax=Leishmania panamensis TaxID=5679 RepID=A0A088RH50_LEIPA|nr:hypothetical protein LPMP_030670 [Leishmania panamensis]AIN95302.1 hypothetical protein LPMP_030670 [Leishmania panamensis]
MTSRMGVLARCSTALWRRSFGYGSRESVGVPVKSPPVSTSLPRFTTTFIPSSPNATEHPLSQPLHTSRRHYGTGSGSGAASGSGGGLSLIDLAKVFQQLSSDDARDIQQNQGDHSGGSDTAAPTTTTAVAAAADASLSSAQQEIDYSGSDAVPRDKSEPALHRPLISFSPLYATRLTTLTEAQFCTELENRLGKLDYSSMMQCLHEVVRRLSPLLDSAAAGDDSDEYRAKRQRRKVSEWAAEAEGDVTSAARSLMPNQRLLTAVLSVLNRMDLYVMETETKGSPRSISATAPPCTDLSPPQKPQPQPQPHRDRLSLPAAPLSVRLSRLLLQWLSREVSCMDTTTSLQVLHLLAQQRLVHMEAVLQTLVDSIVVHLERCGSTAATVTPSESTTARAFTLEEYSLLFDTMARFQAQLLRLSYLRQSTEQAHHLANPSAAEPGDGMSVGAGGTNATAAGAALITGHTADPCLASAAAAVRRRALDRSNHPVANGRLFHHLAEALSLTLTSGQQGRLSASMTGATADAIGPAKTSARLLKINTTSFLFLTRALSKLQWWHDGLAAALAAPLTGYVRAHPESALVVVGLVGRRENRSGDVALLEALQDSLATLLLRRRGALKAPTEVAQALRQGRVTRLNGDADVKGGASGLVSWGTQHGSVGAVGESPHRLAEAAMRGVKRADSPTRTGINAASENKSWEWGEEEEEGEEADMRLFSSITFSTTPEAHRRSRKRFAASASPPGKAASDSAASLTLIDLHALPGTVEALCRFHVRTIAAVPPPSAAGAAAAATAGDDVRARLVHGMRELLSLVLDDAVRGITSIDDVARTLAPAFLSRVLLALLGATAQLQQAWGAGGSGASVIGGRGGEHASTATAQYPHHPLVIELAYAWMMQVMRKRCPPRPPPASQIDEHTAAATRYHRVAALTYWRRAIAVHEALVRAGLLCRTRPYAVCASNPAGTLRGRYYMPDDVLHAAPRVHAAVQRTKMRIEAERQREAAERAKAAEQQQQQAAASRYASAMIRGSAQRQRSSVASPSSLSFHHQRRHPTAAQPARTTDVFADYTKALSRLL